jgi:hypothetical protein
VHGTERGGTVVGIPHGPTSPAARRLGHRAMQYNRAALLNWRDETPSGAPVSNFHNLHRSTPHRAGLQSRIAGQKACLLISLHQSLKAMLERFFCTLRIGLTALALAVFAPAVYAQGGPGGGGATLSSEDVSDQEIQSAAEIIVAMQFQRQQMRKQMMQKYGNPQEMDSTQRRKARMEIMKKRQALMQKKTKEEGLSAQRLQQIMKSARQDSTLRTRVRSAVQARRQEQMGGSPSSSIPDSTGQDSGGR